ncbi:MAG: hypothetical protein AAFZ07_18745 [Actinomycetota bacterium]
MSTRNHLAIAAAGLALVVAACGDSSSTLAEPTSTTVPPTTTTAATTAPIDGALTLDYTAFVAGAVQPSGIGISADGSLAAVVTDFERVVVIETATQAPVAELAVGRGELPRQGATEGVAFLDAERLAVLYPDDRLVGIFGLDGELLDEIEVRTAGSVDGAITVVDGELVVVVRQADSAALHLVDPATGDAIELHVEAVDVGPFEGLSPTADGGGVLAVTGDGTLHTIELADGTVVPAGFVADVGEPSGVEVFVNPDEDEVQIGITDDADEYNAEPSPLRLYLG